VNGGHHLILFKDVIGCPLFLQRLFENQLVSKAKKCSFHTDNLVFLGHVVTPAGIRMEESKTVAIRDSPEPKTLKQLRSFLTVTVRIRASLHLRLTHKRIPPN
jgi:hypothetical protein